MTDSDLSPANYPAEPPPVELDDLDRLPGSLPRTERRGPALLAHAGRAVTRRRCAWCDEPATVLIDGGGWDDPACDRHAEQWGHGRAQRPIGGDSG